MTRRSCQTAREADRPGARRLNRAVLFPVLLLAACTGGGPSGPPGDTTPPAAPRTDRLRVEVPAGGETTVSGTAGAVEGEATVIIDNVTAAGRTGAPVNAQTRASVDGAFTTRVPAVTGDELSILARDDAGNRGPAVRLPAGPDLSTAAVSAVSGTGQTGVVGRPLTDPFRVRVRGGSPAVDLPDVPVAFEVVSGGGTLDRQTATSDAGGVAESRLTLGPAQGPVRVRARLVSAATEEVLFDVEGTGAPELDDVSPGEADRGATVTLGGRNFSPIAVHNVVEFNGVVADVLSAAPELLAVRVPVFSSDGAVTVTLTGVRSNGLPFKVRGEPPPLQAVGTAELERLTPGGGTSALEVRLPFVEGDEEYVVAVQALSTAAQTSFNHSLVGDEAAAPGAALQGAGGAGGPRLPKGAAGVPALAAAAGQPRADAVLRGLEAELAERAKGVRRGPAVRLQGGPPQIGDVDEFHVINTLDNVIVTDPRNFDSVRASLRYVGGHTLVYVDERVPAVDLSDADVRAVGDRFENQTYGVDREAFGSESDLNGDGRITILLTPTVNEMNEGMDPQDGIVIGFFFGLDLLPDLSPATSNGFEIFYGFVPDPGGRFGPPVPRDFAIPTLDELFAHEFQHMISFNEHVLVRGGQSEALWLNEGLSHLAEELNGFDAGNDVRSALYLDDPGSTGLAVSGGGNSLAERGASFLFLRHLGDRLGEEVFGALVQTRFTGQANLEFATGESFSQLFSDFFAALVLDGHPGADPRFDVPSLTLRETYEAVRTLNPTLALGPYLALRALQLPGGSSSAATAGTAGAFYAVTTGGTVPNERRLRVTSAPLSLGQVTVIRTR
ncbi:MAG TPA: hypothetical protein VIC56_06185 [Gemmatimonadota bacterium]|jgi:hypothetical protein